MRINLPAFLEVKPDVFRSIQDCTYAEILLARKRADHPTRAQIDRLLEINGAVWKAFPLMTVEDMIGR